MANANLALKVRKYNLKLVSINNLDLPKKLGINVFLNFALLTLVLPPPISLIVLLLITNTKFLA